MVDVNSGDDIRSPMPCVDTDARPDWVRAGYKFFPFAARQSGRWWVLRTNFDFPEHPLYTLFIDGRPAADISGDVDSPSIGQH